MTTGSNILLVEDDAQYARLVQIAFQEAHVPEPVHVLSDGSEAISYLKGEGRFADRERFPLPELVVLDLNMPLVGGFELLQWIRSQKTLDSVRTAVLTGSETGDAPQRALDLGADCYQVKPFEFRGLVQAVTSLCDNCLHTAAANLSAAA